MYPVSGRFLTACTQSHTVTSRVDVWQGGVVVLSDLPVVSGTVVVDRGSQIRRSLDLTLAMDKAPFDLSNMLMPTGTELAVYRGIVFDPSHTEWVPVGVYRIDTLRINRPTLTITLRGSDRGIALQDDRFLLPQPAAQGHVKSEIKHLVGQTLPTVTIDDQTTGRNLAMWPVTWERERLEALEKLASSVAADCYFGPDGTYLMRDEPTTDHDPVFTIAAGVALLGNTTEVSRLDTYNAVVVTGDTMGENPNVSAVAKDMDPTSPTFWDGAFGHRPRFYSSQFITNDTDAQRVADAQLGKFMGLPRTLDLSAVPNPALDAGDVIEVAFVNGVREKHVVDGLRFGLDAGSTMTVQTRTVSKVVGA